MLFSSASFVKICKTKAVLSYGHKGNYIYACIVLLKYIFMVKNTMVKSLISWSILSWSTPFALNSQ
jgi:hypothetical protein